MKLKPKYKREKSFSDPNLWHCKPQVLQGLKMYSIKYIIFLLAIEIVKPPPDIYHGCSTRKKFWEEKFTPVNMTSCVRINVRRHREIKNGEKYIILDISYKIDCLYKMLVNSLKSKDYMGRPVKELTNSLDLSTKR